MISRSCFLHYLGILGIAALSSTGTLLAGVEEDASLAMMRKMVERITASGAVVRIAGKWHEDVYNPIGAEASSPGAYGTFTTLIDLGSKELLRCSFDPYGVVWTHGAAPFLESSGEIINDGKTWMEIIDKSGVPGRLHEMHTVTIGNTHPDYITSQRLESGEGLFLTRARDALGAPLLPLLTGELPPYRRLEVTHQANGLVEIKVADLCTSETVTLDPKLAYALCRHEIRYNLCQSTGGKLVMETTFSDQQEVLPFLWIPRKAAATETEDGKVRFHRYLEISSAGVEEKPSSDTFKFKIPPLWRVIDERFGVDFTVGEKPEAVMRKTIDSLPLEPLQK